MGMKRRRTQLRTSTLQILRRKQRHTRLPLPSMGPAVVTLSCCGNSQQTLRTCCLLGSTPCMRLLGSASFPVMVSAIEEIENLASAVSNSLQAVVNPFALVNAITSSSTAFAHTQAIQDAVDATPLLTEV